MKFKGSVVAVSLVFSSNIGLVHSANENHDYSTTANIGLRAGSSQVEGFVDFIVPMWQNDRSFLFLNPRFLLADEGNNQLNAGIGFRYLFENRGVLGANLFIDSRESNFGNRFQQFGAGLEWLGKTIDARVNLYNAQDDVDLINSFETSETQTTQSISTDRNTVVETSRFGIANPTASGNQVTQQVQTNIATTTTVNRTITTRSVTTNRTFEQFEGALDGWDAEIGFKLPLKKGPEVRVFGGYYHFDNPFNGDDISGAKARIEVRSGPYLSFDAEFFEDSFDQTEPGNDYFIGARLEVPLTGKNTWKNVLDNLFGNPNRSLRDRLRHEMVIRDVRIHTQISDPQENENLRSQNIAEQIETQSATSTDIETSVDTEVLASNIFFVDDDNAGVETGTVNNPFRTIAAAIAAAPANATVFVCESGGGVCDLNGGGGTFDETTGITLQSGQVLTSTIAGVGGSAGFTTQNRPNITNSSQAVNTGVINTAVAGGNTINRLNVSVTAAGNNRHGILNNQSAAPVTIVNSEITSNASSNSNTILNTQTNATVTVANNTLTSNSQNGDGIENNATVGNVVIRNNTFNGTAQNSRGVFNNNTVGDITISNNTLSTSGTAAEGIQNSNSQGALSISDNIITTTGPNSTAILINNNSASNITTTGNTITTTDGDGFNSSGNTGTIVLSGNTITTSGNNREGILNTNPTNTITIASNTVTTNGNNSEAIQNNNSTGDISVTGNTVTTNGTGAEGIFNNNAAATPAPGTTTNVANNTVITNNASADGIVNIGRVDVAVSNNTVTTSGDGAEGIRGNRTDGETISGNTVTTAGDNAEGIDTNNSTGDLTISNNTINTSGTGAEGIFNRNITGANTTISGNTINTGGNNSEGIDIVTGASAANISANTIITQGTNSHAVNTTGVNNTANIQSNNLNTNQTNAFGTRNRANAGGVINVDGNTICVPVGGQSANNGGAGVINIGPNTLLNQTPCP